MLPLLAEGAFRQLCLDGDVGGGHQLVHRAAICHTVQFVLEVVLPLFAAAVVTVEQATVLDLR